MRVWLASEWRTSRQERGDGIVVVTRSKKATWMLLQSGTGSWPGRAPYLPGHFSFLFVPFVVQVTTLDHLQELGTVECRLSELPVGVLDVLPPSSGSKSNQSKLLPAGYLFGLLFDPEDRGSTFFRNLIFFGLHGVTSQKPVVLIEETVKESEPAIFPLTIHDFLHGVCRL
jgi:hypothetical protein